ncbi:MAG: sensor histidine kinase [Acidobacteriota bacterium]
MRLRVPPLSIAFALMAAALVATTWSTRSAVTDAFDSVRDGQALTAEQAVRADLADLGGPPSADDLQTIVHDRQKDGLRYLALVDNHGSVVAAAGAARVTQPATPPARGERPVQVTRVGDRVRIEMRAAFRRAWGSALRGWWVVMELEPSEALALEHVASRTLWIGALAALTLLGVALALVRRELRRHAEERAREHERRLASLGEMSAVLAHEIKNPLASLKGNAQLLAAMLPEGDKPRGKADRVVDEARRLERLVQDLLAFVRTGELAREPVDVGELVRAAAGDAEVTVEAKTWSLDRERMRQVIANLTDNARAAGAPVRVRAREDGDRLVVEVADSGPGVPEADRDKIFEPFFTSKTRGTGLGLAIVRRIVELHGGSISVRNEGGAVFRVEIPR